MKINKTTKLLLKIIGIYQIFFSLDHGVFSFLRPYGHCRFYPTCSEYTYQAIEHYGATKGIVIALKRVIRCVPTGFGSYDPLKK